jgi:hypothetical protein
MRIQIKCDWREDEKLANADRRALKLLFGLSCGLGRESVRTTEGNEYRATAELNTDDYKIIKKV